MTMKIPEPTDKEKAKIVPKSPPSAKQPRLDYIRKCRELGFTDRAIAEKLGIHQSNVSEFMKNRGELRSVYNWEKKDG